MDCGAHGEQQFKLVDGSGDEPIETEAEYLENELSVVKHGEPNLHASLVFEKVFPGLHVGRVLEADAGGDDGVCQRDNNDDDVVNG